MSPNIARCASAWNEYDPEPTVNVATPSANVTSLTPSASASGVLPSLTDSRFAAGMLTVDVVLTGTLTSSVTSSPSVFQSDEIVPYTDSYVPWPWVRPASDGRGDLRLLVARLDR